VGSTDGASLNPATHPPRRHRLPRRNGSLSHQAAECRERQEERTRMATQQCAAPRLIQHHFQASHNWRYSFPAAHRVTPDPPAATRRRHPASRARRKTAEAPALSVGCTTRPASAPDWTLASRVVAALEEHGASAADRRRSPSFSLEPTWYAVIPAPTPRRWAQAVSSDARVSAWSRPRRRCTVERSTPGVMGCGVVGSAVTPVAVGEGCVEMKSTGGLRCRRASFSSRSCPSR
jgi:hypothetical protein